MSTTGFFLADDFGEGEFGTAGAAAGDLTRLLADRKSVDDGCGNCGAPAESLCSMACPDRLLASAGRQRLAV